MAKYFNRLSSVIDILREQDSCLDDAVTLEEVKTVLNTANFYNLRVIAINTAIIADVLDRISTDRTDLPIDDLLKIIGDNQL